MIIRKGDNTQLTEHFKTSEFFSKSPDAPNEHYLDDALIGAAELIRRYFGVPVRVNSSFRTKAHNKAIGGKSNSMHLSGKALDLSFPGNHDKLLKYHQEILTKGDLYKQLRQAGINGFGLYDNFLHIDTRPSGKHQDSYGTYSFWDNRTWTKKKTSITDYWNALNDSEDGNLDNNKLIDGTILISLLIIFIVLSWVYKKYGW